MELRVIDFEILTRNFQPYVDGYKEIESEKRKMLESVDPDKKEMESIIKRSQSGLVLDEASQKKDMDAFRQIQEKLMKLDQDFKRKLKEMSDELNTNEYDFVMSTIALQHICVYDIRYSIMKDIHRVLKDGGVFTAQG